MVVVQVSPEPEAELEWVVETVELPAVAPLVVEAMMEAVAQVLRLWLVLPRQVLLPAVRPLKPHPHRVLLLLC